MFNKNEKPYACKFCKENFAYSKSSMFNKNEKPFACKFCKENFANVATLENFQPIVA
jgi:predicted SprT family Zn-dependent metalloprotease